MEEPKKIIYLHGFNSSSFSKKSRVLDSYLKENKYFSFESPDLSISPKEAIAKIEKKISKKSSGTVLIGSSLGGLYSTFLGNKYQLKSVTINPVVKNHIEGMEGLIGKHKNFHTDEECEFFEEDFEDLKKLGLSKLKDPLNHLCLVKMGDKVLDHQITRRYFSNSYVVCEKNGNHSYDDFLEKIPLILDYLF